MSACGMDPQVGQAQDGLSFSLCSTLCPHISFRQEQFWVKIFGDGWMVPFLNQWAMPNLWVSTGSPSPLWGISSNIIPVGSWEALAFLASGTFWLLLPVPHPLSLHTSLYSIS